MTTIANRSLERTVNCAAHTVLAVALCARGGTQWRQWPAVQHNCQASRMGIDRILRTPIRASAFVMLAISVAVAPAHAQDRLTVLGAVAADIEKLKADFPQLRDFSAGTHLRAEPPSISYAFRTHAPERTGGWTSGVPNPDVDGIWFHIDLHDPGSRQQLHTQPVTVPICLGESRVSFLMLEGRDTRSLYGPIWSALTKQGARQCGR
jgi:hypothetical protein